jgi:hypothetical protein
MERLSVLSMQSISTATAHESCRICTLVGTPLHKNVGQTRRGKKPHDPSPQTKDIWLSPCSTPSTACSVDKETAAAMGSPNIYFFW